MAREKSLAHDFQDNRPHLRALAYRMLGSRAEADDALQEAWLRISRAETESVENLSGWLTTVVARVCLDLLRTRKARRESPESESDSAPLVEPSANIEEERVLADSVGLALLVVLDTLSPGERLAFVLHDTFELPFDEIARILGCEPAAARQLASRARRRVQGAPPDSDADPDPAVQQRVVEAFLLAARTGDLAGLLAVLAPNVVLRADLRAVTASAASTDPNAPRFAPETRGPDGVAGTFNGRARAARPAQVNGAAGAVWAPGGTPRVAFDFTVADGLITRIEVIAEPERLGRLQLELSPT